MTLPNNLGNTNKKLSSIWESLEFNRNFIEEEKNKIVSIRQELNKTVPSAFKLKDINNLNLPWQDLVIYKTDVVGGDTVTTKAYLSWDIPIIGLSLNKVGLLKHNYLIRFGSGEPLIDSNIDTQNTLVRTHDYIQYDEGVDNIITFCYSIYFEDIGDGINEIDDNGMQVKLNLTLKNPDDFT